MSVLNFISSFLGTLLPGDLQSDLTLSGSSDHNLLTVSVDILRQLYIVFGVPAGLFPLDGLLLAGHLVLATLALLHLFHSLWHFKLTVLDFI